SRAEADECTARIREHLGGFLDSIERLLEEREAGTWGNSFDTFDDFLERDLQMDPAFFNACVKWCVDFGLACTGRGDLEEVLMRLATGELQPRKEAPTT
ncbi:MAG: hypothetical protein QOD99_2977, partial [Chthoniobacter sp.]|nr:hypothetical protein [Chthoniobacter sp.]